jgi:F-type H+-transporting ATPase subunit b
MLTLHRVLPLLAVALALLAPAVALAEAKPPAGGEADKAGAGEEKPKGWHEQPGSFIDIHRYDLGIYTLVVFGLLFLILAKFAWKPFTEGLAKREASIAAAKDEAVRAKHEAEVLRGQLKAEFASAQDKIRAMMDEARRDADALKASEKAVGLKEAEAERDRAKREIETAKEQALQEIQQTAVQLASLMSTKAVGRSMTDDDHRRLVAESLSELKTSVTRA